MTRPIGPGTKPHPDPTYAVLQESITHGTVPAHPAAALDPLGGVPLRRPAVPSEGARSLSPKLLLSLAVVTLAAAVALLSSAVWALWGSDYANGLRQQELVAELEALDDPSFYDSAGEPLIRANGGLVVPRNVPAEGAPFTRISIPAIDVDHVVVSGVTVDTLKDGPGWIPGTALPGEQGNSVISGHRTTYGAPFHDLDELEAGDTITLASPGGTSATYEVRASFIVEPEDVWVADHTDGARLTLTTCNPIGSDRERLVIQAEQIDGPAKSSALPAEDWVRSQKPRGA